MRYGLVEVTRQKSRVTSFNLLCKQTQEKNYTTIPIALDRESIRQSPTLTYNKNCQQIRNRRTLLRPYKGIYEKLSTNVFLGDGRLVAP